MSTRLCSPKKFKNTFEKEKVFMKFQQKFDPYLVLLVTNTKQILNRFIL